MKRKQKKAGKSLLFWGLVGASLRLVSPSVAQAQDVAGQMLLPQGSILETESVVLNLDRYPIVGAAPYDKSSSLRLTTQVNHISPGTTLQLQALQEDVWVYVQFFTDINGDGIYEWTVNEYGLPLWQVLGSDGSLGGQGSALSQDEIRTLAAMDLYGAGMDSLLDRGSGGDQALSQLSLSVFDRSVFCVTLSPAPYHQYSPQMSESQEEASTMSTYSEVETPGLVTYYLQLDPLGYEDSAVTGAATYSDVSPTDWFYKGVDYAVKNKFFQGTDNVTFSPQSTLTRGMALQTLYAYAGKPLVVGKTFSDVPHSAWYYAASCWAVDQGVAVVESGNNLRPDDQVTRQELLGFLYNFAKKEGASLTQSSNMSQYSDLSSINPAYAEAMSWAVEHKLIVGSNDGNLNPTGSASRCEAALIIMNFMNYVLLA